MINLGTTIPTWGSPITDSGLNALVDIVEDTGLNAAWFSDHLLLSERDIETYPYYEKFHTPARDDWFDAIVCASQVATRPSSLDLIFGVILAAVRPPLELARQIASLSRLAGDSKVILGVGTGWSRAEHEAMGMDFDTRGDALDEAIRLIREVWTGRPTPGKYGKFNIPDKTFTNPTPVIASSPITEIPIFVGGNAKAPMRRAARLGDGWIGYLASWEDNCKTLAALISQLNLICMEIGRDINDLELAIVQTVPGNISKDPAAEARLREVFEQYETLGITRVTLGMSWADLNRVHTFLGIASVVASKTAKTVNRND
tara:strand:+ start:605 stop:1552 length:948 start_codon:yes stop_codon:yes gene_type:complete